MIARSGRAERLAAWVIFATILLDFMGFTILIPVLPTVLQELGADAVDIGVVLALYVIAMVVFLPFWGWVSDRVGRRPVLLVCLLGTAASFALMAVADTLTTFYVARILAGFFGASVGTAQAYMTDITSDEDRAGGLGMIGAATALGALFGPALGGLLLNIDPALPFWVPVVVALAAFLGAMLFLPESRSPPPEATGWKGLARTFIPTPVLVFFISEDNRSRLYLYLFLHVFAAFAALEGMFPLYAEERFAWSELEVGLFLSYVAIVFALTQLVLVSRLTPILGEVVLSAAGLGLLALGLLGMGSTHSPIAMAFAATITSVGTGMWFPTFTSLFFKACGTAEEAGEFMARSVAMSQAGRGLGIIFGGLAHKHIGVGAEFWLGGIGAAAALAILLAGLPMLVRRR